MEHSFSSYNVEFDTDIFFESAAASASVSSILDTGILLGVQEMCIVSELTRSNAYKNHKAL